MSRRPYHKGSTAVKLEVEVEEGRLALGSGARSAPRDSGSAQTAETCSSSATRNEEPQPQAATTLGLLTLKPAPCRLSS